jgi:hypothetical protein
MEQSQDAKNDSGDASPRLMVLQTQSHTYASRTEDQESGADKVNGDGEKSGERLLLMDDDVKTASEKKNWNSRNEEEGAENGPENAEGLEMSLETRLGDGADRISETATAIRTGDRVGLKLRSTAAAEHGRLRALR